MKKITIAIDGHSSCGKSTMAKELARKVGYVYVDTGAMYRCVTLYAMRHDLFNADGSVKMAELEAQMPQIHVSFQFNAETGLPDAYLNGECVEKEIRSLEVSSHVSPIAAVPFVRTAMVAQQQQMGQGGGVVMDGRDIGTNILPNAELKIYLTASVDVRAKRRFDELKLKGESPDLEEIKKGIETRDYQDMNRDIAPLKQAEDAILIDSSDMTIAEVVDKIIDLKADL